MDVPYFHLIPLSPLDQVNLPPASFLLVQEALVLVSTFGWTAAYVLYCRQAFLDRSYGVPLITLVLNTAWEVVFGLIVPPSNDMVFVAGPWTILEAILIYATIKHGAVEWKHTPLVANNLWWILPSSVVISCGFYLAFIQSFEEFRNALIASALINQLCTSVGAVLHLSKGNTRGHSLGIWVTRTNGTFWTVVAHYWQMIHYPQDHPLNLLPVIQYGMWVFLACDFILYPITYFHVSRLEKKKLT
ncbi:hypothetical protein B0I35DRAFT_405039 [Stachybotrys elegans]|uniref:Uncharacterized protein n=1 Tax=Stachybotrys elegans TaxID=80388 RepID=A0A8K0T0I4_9HYPO|nr:hypothetical protein B0I35DRAFT_405039 [Stachybotrys elegans]